MIPTTSSLSAVPRQSIGTLLASVSLLGFSGIMIWKRCTGVWNGVQHRAAGNERTHEEMPRAMLYIKIEDHHVFDLTRVNIQC